MGIRLANTQRVTMAAREQTELDHMTAKINNYKDIKNTDSIKKVAKVQESIL